MNRISHTPESDDVGPVVDFTVPPPPPPPPPQRREPPPRQQRRSTQPNLAPLPDLGSNLSGIQVDLAGVDMQGVSSVADSLLGDLDNVALTEDSVDDPPAFRDRVVPEYPERARQREIEGRVLVSVLVGNRRTGKVDPDSREHPRGGFRRGGPRRCRALVFVPASYQGNPVEAWVNIPFPFRLN
jgi:protein TonB